MMDAFDLASRLFGNSRAESRGDVLNSLDILTATGAGDSSDGAATVYLDADVTPADDYDGDDYAIGIPTSPNVIEGDGVLVGLTGSGPLKTPVVISNPGSGDRMQAQVDNAEALAQQAEDVAQEAAEDVEQVRQDVADFRDDVATTYATKVEREDGDDAVKTWVTTNYTNSNDLATTYATKTLVSQTKDAIELAASQTYETQSDAAATYATKSALTVGLDGIRSEVAEDYQPKGDYATTASMNSAIQQSASSIESSVAATYETKSDASTTYATKTEVQQTASGLDTRITTATNTANSAKSAVDNLQVGGTNLLWDSAFDDVENTWLKWGTPTTYEVVNVNGVNFLHVKTSGARFEGIQQNDRKRAGVGEISAGEKFVFSIDAYGATNTKLNVGIHWLNSSHAVVVQDWFSFDIDTTPKRYTYANENATPPTNAVAFNIMIGNNTTDVRELWFAHPMLERGTIATDWSPAPEDMATEADLQAEVTERQTLIRQFSGGVLAGYVGNAIAALVNAAGSFDVVRTAWTNGVPSILGTLARYAASGISLFDAAGNVLAEFASDHVRIGGDVPIGDSTDGGAASVQFFDQTSTHTSHMDASTYIDEQAASGDYGAYYDMRNETSITTSLDDDGRVVDTNSNGTASMQLTQELSYGISDVDEQHNEVTAALVADASYSDGAATSHAAVRATASTTGGSDLSYAELIADALGIGENEGAIDYFTMDAVRSAFPVTLYDNASASASAAATLSETAANYSRLTIFFKDNDGTHGSVDVWSPDGKRVALPITWINGASTQEMYQRVRWVTISGTSISTYKASGDAKYRTGQIKLGATASVTNSDYISIVHVIGWR